MKEIRKSFILQFTLETINARNKNTEEDNRVLTELSNYEFAVLN